MRLTPRRLLRDNTGSTLVVSMLIIAILAIFIGLAFDFTSNTAIVSSRGRDYSAAQAAANGALDAAYKIWQNYMTQNQANAIPSSPSTSNYTDATNFVAPCNNAVTQINTALSSTPYKLLSLSINPVDLADNSITRHYSGASTGGNGQVAAPGTASIGPMPNVPGWIATTYNYRAIAVVQKKNNLSFQVTTSRFFQHSDASLYQAMLFFQNDLELHPGAAMTLYGLVHTNSNMYMATGASLTLSSDVSYHGNTTTLSPVTTSERPATFYASNDGYVEGVTQTLFNQESGTWNAYNDPTYAQNSGLSSSANRAQQLSHVQPLYPLGADESSSIVAGNGNATGDHEIIERPVPISSATSGFNPSANTSVADPAAFSSHRVYNSAGLRVFINHATSFTTSTAGSAASMVKVYVPSASNPEQSVEILPGSTPSTQNIANAIISAITVDTGTAAIYDFREGRAINSSTVDMSKLTPALNNYAGFNGVLYITDVTNADSSGNTDNSSAIRLSKGGVLPNNGLTVVSDGAVYVQGDYNTGATYGPDQPNGSPTLTSQPVSNSASGDPSQYTVSGYVQKPAAVMGDAVMVLSNSWVDANSYNALSTRVATPTTFNAAIVSGQVLTTPESAPTANNGVASGGAHNFPRFLENWGAINFTYHGSMCELYPSSHFTGSYGKSNVYSPPNRRWFFDNSFLTSPPPGNLRSTTYARGRWFGGTNS